MEFAAEFGLKGRGSLDAATQWQRMLDRAVDEWVPRIPDEQLERTPYWIGTGVASASRSANPDNDAWTAVAILETPAVLRNAEFRDFWQRADLQLRAEEASFAALVVGRVRIAAGAVVGGSVGVPGGCMGTLGGAVTSERGCVALTAGHVVWSGAKGGTARQPASAVDGPQMEIGRVIGWSRLRWRHNNADLGLISLHPDSDGGERSVLSERRPEDVVGLPVRKTGARTGPTSGRVTLIADKVPLHYGARRRYFDRLLGIEAEGDGERFAWEGDSGALVLPDGQPPGADAAVGMVVGASGIRLGQPMGWAIGSTAISANMDQILRSEARTEV